MGAFAPDVFEIAEFETRHSVAMANVMQEQVNN